MSLSNSGGGSSKHLINDDRAFELFKGLDEAHQPLQDDYNWTKILKTGLLGKDTLNIEGFEGFPKGFVHNYTHGPFSNDTLTAMNDFESRSLIFAFNCFYLFNKSTLAIQHTI